MPTLSGVRAAWSGFVVCSPLLSTIAKKELFSLLGTVSGRSHFYYTVNHNRLVFASELSAMVNLENEEFEIDQVALSQYLMLGYVPDPRSIFAHVHKLPPAHYATIDLVDPVVTPRCYWSLSVEPDESLSESHIRSMVHDLLQGVRGLSNDHGCSNRPLSFRRD